MRCGLDIGSGVGLLSALRLAIGDAVGFVRGCYVQNENKKI